jgi:hypothetical protein
MRTRNSRLAAGGLIILALFVLLILGKVDLLAILLPICLLLAYSIARFGTAKTKLTSSLRKG